MVQGIEEMLKAHLKQNELVRMDVGISDYGDRASFICTLWWNDTSSVTGLSCTAGHGVTVTEAFGDAADLMGQKRNLEVAA